MAEMKRLVHLVDDDEAVRHSTSFMLRQSGYSVKPYASGTELLAHSAELQSGCILLDIRMPVMDGLEVQQELKDRNIRLPVIVMTGHGDVGIAVRAMKIGAVDFIEKPFESEILLGAVDEGFARIDAAGRMQDGSQAAKARLKVLTPRESDVLRCLARGLSNKRIAIHLGISPRTVEIHRAKVMSKLEVGSLSEALRLAFAAGLGAEESVDQGPASPSAMMLAILKGSRPPSSPLAERPEPRRKIYSRT